MHLHKQCNAAWTVPCLEFGGALLQQKRGGDLPDHRGVVVRDREGGGWRGEGVVGVEEGAWFLLDHS